MFMEEQESVNRYAEHMPDLSKSAWASSFSVSFVAKLVAFSFPLIPYICNLHYGFSL